MNAVMGDGKMLQAGGAWRRMIQDSMSYENSEKKSVMKHAVDGLHYVGVTTSITDLALD